MTGSAPAGAASARSSLVLACCCDHLGTPRLFVGPDGKVVKEVVLQSVSLAGGISAINIAAPQIVPDGCELRYTYPARRCTGVTATTTLRANTAGTIRQGSQASATMNCGWSMAMPTMRTAP